MSVYRTRIPRIIRDAGLAEQALVEATAQAIAADARSRVEDYDPELAATIRVAKTGLAAREVRAGSSRRFEGHLVEWGSVNNAACPFLTPAAEGAAAGFEQAIQALYR